MSDSDKDLLSSGETASGSQNSSGASDGASSGFVNEKDESAGGGESVVDIPANLKDEFENFEDVDRSEEDKQVFTPAEVVKKTQLMSNEIAEEVETEEFHEDLDNSLKMDSGLDYFLSQLNVTRKQFVSFVVFFLGLLVLVIVSFVYLFKYFGSSQEQVKVVGVVDPNPSVVEIPAEPKESLIDKIKSWLPEFGGETSAENVPGDEAKNESDSKNQEDVVVDDGNVDNGDSEELVDGKDEPVIPASEVGKTDVVNIETISLNAAKVIGTKSVQADRLNYFVRTYRKVRNIFNTDLFSYLAQTPDRAKAYDLFVIQFKGANEEAKLVYEELRQEVGDLEARVARLQADTTEVENIFFNSLDNLDSEVIASNLKAFQDISQKRDLANSELKARLAIADRFARALPVIDTKIKAIELNRDPFVQGVRVVDFEQVDLDLIIKP